MPVKKPVPYHSMIRYLGVPESPEDGIFSATTVDEHVKQWVDQGYEVFASYPVGSMVLEGRRQPAEGIYFLFRYVE